MSKAVLVMDMPGICGCCRMYQGNYFSGGDCTCRITGKNVELNTKPGNCPLRELTEIVAITDLQEIQQYRELGTVEECRAAVEKQNTKPLEEKVNPSFPHMGKMYYCVCGTAYLEMGAKYCGNCGQRLE